MSFESTQAALAAHKREMAQFLRDHARWAKRFDARLADVNAKLDAIARLRRKREARLARLARLARTGPKSASVAGKRRRGSTPNDDR